MSHHVFPISETPNDDPPSYEEAMSMQSVPPSAPSSSEVEPIFPRQLNAIQSVPKSTLQPKWVSSRNGDIPPGAVVGGRDLNGETLYIARGVAFGALTPGKLVPSHKCCYISWNGKEHSLNQYEVLCNCPGTWSCTKKNIIPLNAVPGGVSESRETLYIGRVKHDNTLTNGKVHPSYKKCFIPYAGTEHGYKDYEIYVSDYVPIN